MPGSALYTYADLANFPDDGMRRELLDGELIVSPSPKVRHQRLLRRLAMSFMNHIENNPGGEMFFAPLDVVLSDINVVEPDLFFIADSQSDVIGEKNVQGPPMLVVEVVSDTRLDRVRKRDIYARFGVPEYWIVDPDADRVEVYLLEGSSYAKPIIVEPGEVLTFGGLPGLVIDVAALFAR